MRPDRPAADRANLRGQRPRHPTHDLAAGLLATIRSARGRPRHRPTKLHADKAYDIPALRTEIRRRGITVRIARKGIESTERLGRHRWIVEACLSWLLNNRRLVRRYERKADHFQAFADLACLLLSYRRWAKVTK